MSKDSPLLDAESLAELAPGVSGAHISAASAQVRRLCGWHIAPSLTQTVILDHDGAEVLRLPSLHVSSVESVEDLTGTKPRELSGYRWSRAGMIEGSLPSGFGSVRVTFTHGYSRCPDDVARIVAQRATRRVMQESVGGVSRTYGVEGDRAVESTLEMYKLGPRA